MHPLRRACASIASGALLLASLAGCHDHGASAPSPSTLTGLWSVPAGIDVGMRLELLDTGDGTLSGKLLIDHDGTALGDYVIQGGTVDHSDFSFTVDPLDPPLTAFLESLGNNGSLRFAGHLDRGDVLSLSVDQTCATEECFSADASTELPASIFTNSATMDRPFGRAGAFANLALVHDPGSLTGFITITFGNQQGGVTLPAMPIRNGGVTDSNLVFFLVYPADDPTGALAESLGCSAPIIYAGLPDAGSTVRFFVLQREIDGADTTICVRAATAWPGAEVFAAYRDTTDVVIGQEAPAAYDMVIATQQVGSVITGSVTFENDAVREGPYTIEEGRFFNGAVTFTIRPAERGSIPFVTSLGSAAPMAFRLEIESGRTVLTAARQDCPCLDETLEAPRLPVGF